ncbi:MAG: septum formation protein Maf [Clostridia bacterium]|nr:septum formation protein Maf [Clostridia bacterium]
MRPIILASASPRRREICEKLGLTFSVEPAATEAPLNPSLPLADGVLRIARSKAESVFALHPTEAVLGSDTVVAVDVDGRATVLGKPADPADAARMLRLLSGRTHRVLTAVWLCTPERCDGFVSENHVTFASLSDEDIAEYVASGEPLDKAGAYGVQGLGARYVRHIQGDFFAVMGLPAADLWLFLKSFDF